MTWAVPSLADLMRFLLPCITPRLIAPCHVICRDTAAAWSLAGEMCRWSCHYCAHPACHRSPESLSCYLALIQLTSLSKVSPSPRILLSKCCDRDGHDPVHSLQSYPSISLWPTDRYLKASRIATLKVYNCLQMVRAFVILEPSVPFSLPVNQY